MDKLNLRKIAGFNTNISSFQKTPTSSNLTNKLNLGTSPSSPQGEELTSPGNDERTDTSPVRVEGQRNIAGKIGESSSDLSDPNLETSSSLGFYSAISPNSLSLPLSGFGGYMAGSSTPTSSSPSLGASSGVSIGGWFTPYMPGRGALGLRGARLGALRGPGSPKASPLISGGTIPQGDFADIGDYADLGDLEDYGDFDYPDYDDTFDSDMDADMDADMMEEDLAVYDDIGDLEDYS